MTSYSFLLDRDVAKTAPLFRRKRTRTIAQIALPENASDREIIRMACGENSSSLLLMATISFVKFSRFRNKLRGKRATNSEV